MQREAHFLDFRPSQIAAASLLFAINISTSDVAPQINIKKIEALQMKSLFFETAIYMEVAGIKIEEKDVKDPLRMWNASLQKLTCIKKDQDIEPVYKSLVEKLNEQWYQNKLDDDPNLFLYDSSSEESYTDSSEDGE